jgi:ABC-type multidrug transport system ATPase subunit
MLRIGSPGFSLHRRPLSAALAIEVPPGEVHLLRGPNGCGKSLLFDAITGIHPDRSVRVQVGKRDLTRSGVYSRWKAGLRRMFQAPRFAPGLSPRSVFDSTLSDRASTALTGSALSLLEQSGVDLDRPLAQHSFGQRRIVEMLVALGAEHACLLDEPFAGIRPELAHDLVETIQESARSDKAILIIDHTASRWEHLYGETVDWPVSPDNVALTDQAGGTVTAPSPPSKDVHASWSVRSFSIGGRTLAKDLDLYLKPGVALVLRGANGSGKSTLLRALAEVDQPHAGARIDLERSGNASMLLSPQPPKLAHELSAEDSLRLMIGGGASVATSVMAEARNLVHWLGIDPQRLRSPAEVLSGGEEGAIALVGAVLSQADLLLLDEPFESLAPWTLNRAAQLLNQTLRSGKMLVIATHRAVLDSAFAADHILDLSTPGILTGACPPTFVETVEA